MKTTESTRPFWRQGDIYFVKLDREPELDEAKPIKTGIIARGEESGHMHRLSATSLAEGSALLSAGGSMFLRTAESGATIVHDEHGPIQLPKGTYAVVNQREFDGIVWRAVLD